MGSSGEERSRPAQFYLPEWGIPSPHFSVGERIFPGASLNDDESLSLKSPVEE